MASHQIIVRLAIAADVRYIPTILSEIEKSAKVHGTGICQRSHQEIAQRIYEGNAVIAATANGEWTGFCYIKAWDNDRFVSTCALIVSPLYRNTRVATQMKEKAFLSARIKYPLAKLFGLTTSLAVMKINTGLGFKPVTYSEISSNEKFWDACKSCPNYGILLRKDRKNCLCTAMLFEEENSQASLFRNSSGLVATNETSLQKKSTPVEVAI